LALALWLDLALAFAVARPRLRARRGGRRGLSPQPCVPRAGRRQEGRERRRGLLLGGIMFLEKRGQRPRVPALGEATRRGVAGRAVGGKELRCSFSGGKILRASGAGPASAEHRQDSENGFAEASGHRIPRCFAARTGARLTLSLFTESDQSAETISRT